MRELLPFFYWTLILLGLFLHSLYISPHVD
jgi:hypothetical protein